MWEPHSSHVAAAVVSTAAALLCSVVSQYLSSSCSELYSDLLCWSILPVLMRTATRRHESAASTKGALPGAPAVTAASSLSLWAVAACVATVSVFKAENNVVLGFFPALTPMLLAVQKSIVEPQPRLTLDIAIASTPITNVWGSVPVAILAIILLTGSDLLKHLPSLVPIAALLVVFTSFLPRPKSDDTKKTSRWIPSIDIEEFSCLASKVALLLAFALVTQTLLLGAPRSPFMPAIALGLSKAWAWYFITRSAQSTSWTLATTIGTFSLMATRNPFQQTSELQAIGNVVASIITLGQTVLMIPRSSGGRNLLWSLILVPLVPYLANQYSIRHLQSMAPTTFGQGLLEHPVEGLIRLANSNFERLQDTQSRTYADACIEYRRRYKMEPPPGFEAWYNFAVANESPIIDDFDTMYASISPFWRISGTDVVEAMKEVQSKRRSEVWHCTASAGRANTTCSHAYRKFDRHISLLFDKLLTDVPEVRLDTTFLVNHLDEPRVLIPGQTPESDRNSPQISMTSMARQPIWNTITRSCPPNEEEGRTWTDTTVETFGLPFVTNTTAAMDLCQHHEYSELHGFFMSPTSFRLVEGMAPILSAGAPSTMGDILFPSPAYMEDEFQYDEHHDIPWEQKHNRLYWAGSTTGAFATDDRWPSYHRQRFVSLAQNLVTQKHSYLQQDETHPGIVRRALSSFLNGRLFDVAFTRIFECESRQCLDQSAYFRTRSWAHKDEALRSRLVFDLDGNSISGRYYKLLASRSTPLKQTIFREWHDDRLVPWVHYVPVSQSLEEVPELVFYLTSTEDGQRRARDIAENGREWFSRAFRKVDQSIYVYRLMLELARLQDPTREPI